MSGTESVILRGGRYGLGGPVRDILVEDGVVAAVAPGGELSGAAVLSLDDATVLPGLVDTHVHVEQWVIHERSVDLAAATGPGHAARLLREHAAGNGLLFGRDLVPALWDEPPHKSHLDAALGDVPVVVRSIDLHTTWFSSAALALIGEAGHPTGVLRETESIEANARVGELLPAAEVDGWVAAALARLPARGLTGLVDLEYGDNLAAWRRRALSPVRVHAGIWTPWLDAAIAEGRRTGDVLEDTGGRVHVGPYKIVSDGSLNTRTAWCADPYPDHSHGLCLVGGDELRALMRKASAAGLSPAVHAIGDRANTEVLDAFEEIGCGGRIEHAQLVGVEDMPRFARIGVIASVQPQHAVTDRDVADRHWAGRTGRAFAYRSLHDAGARLELGSDAPVSPLEPWHAIADAVYRRDDERAPWHPEQALPVDVAITAACGGRSVPAVGAVADLTVVAGDPLVATETGLRRTPVIATLVAGAFTHRSS
ncbi:amidohydrolase family protein [Actinoplanes sp. NBRC 101535]|uniref:amidohydrolase n=1 Tax=Actinoplanes sp. NBRC 101535 TaxID=3032196 RepID=UPI0024A224B1|nr:amidohydrolase family protein [Actinoplanes sp. NBRC 101535]GLY02274.1 amidohydrolase [Actinoplanes sp. NBRC 101535]